MNTINNSLFLTLWQRIASASGLAPPQNYATDELPLRSELLTADQMEQFGATLAAAHRLAPGRASDWLLARLKANESALIGVCNLLTEAVVANRRITPAGEWLLDNFHLIEEQMRTARRHLPKGYSRELPRLARGPSKRLPRVYDIALQTISHGDGRVDPDSLGRFVTAYQTVTVLTLGELWAIPIMLRLALIENLRRVSARIAAGLIDRNLADSWADQMTVTAEQDPKSLILLIADMARSNPPISTAFVAEFARRLQGQGAALALALTWVEQLLAESHQTIEHFVQSESQRQASAQVSISNCIASLRFLGAMDWREFVESMSRVESALRKDPGGVYGRMDFSTRDVYRHVIEATAKRSRLSEHEIAERAVQFARDAAQKGADDADHGGHSAASNPIVNRMAHVGYYLIDKGLPELEHAAEVHAPRAFPVPAASGKNRRPKARRQRFLFLYPTAIALIALGVTAALIREAQPGTLADWELAPIGILCLLAATQLSVALTNWLATLLVTPRPLPRMDFSQGIPAASRTLVIIPTMLTNASSIDNLVEALEVRFLANRDANLHFGLLTDFCDAPQETLAGDDALLQRAVHGITALIEKYAVDKDGDGGTATDGFFLFHRPRRWNAQERLWMGYERKRGKLADLNSLLRGGCGTNGSECFSCIVGDITILHRVAFVITLDTDTQLLRDAARQCVATMAHPLNRAVFDVAAGRVTDGYSILQPRMAVSVSGTNRSRYARLFGADAGIDPYTRAVSDVYQDVFGEGSFIGKGIYDVDAFERALKSRLPENRILSHDLLEGCYARAALMSDVQLYEDYPTSYRADMNRRHRWTRGDWQIASWLRSRVPAARTGSSPGHCQNPLSRLSQWKILDNLRRSLLPATLTLLLLVGWTRLTPAGFWTLVVIGVTLLPPLAGSIVDLLRKPDDVLPGQHATAVFRAVGAQVAQTVFSLACLPFETYCSLDAIIRTHWRTLVSNKRLLEWTPSADTHDANGANRGKSDSLAASYRLMWVGPLVSAATTVYLARVSPSTLLVAGPILFLWMASPAIAWWISRARLRREAHLTDGQHVFLRKKARKTWAFFETFVGPEDHWLPPDNFQEHPAKVIAHRTSPTNIGLALLANLSAYDFGYIACRTLIERCKNTLDTMAELTQYQGHLYNWYDTETLMPLAPLYISSVDSGNLAGHLLTLRAGLLALPDDPIPATRVFEGLADTLGVLSDHTIDAPATTRTHIDQLTTEIAAACETRPRTLADAKIVLAKCWASVQAVIANLNLDAPDVQDVSGLSATDALWWAAALGGQCRLAIDELELFAPWLASIAPIAAVPDNLRVDFDLDTIRTMREMPALHKGWLIAIEHHLAKDTISNDREWLHALRLHIATADRHREERLSAIDTMARQVTELANMSYDFLYDKRRHLLAIGYNVAERRQDTSFYDMLASESRLASFVAIAQGKLPQESWFALGRLLTPTAGGSTLLSWSGSMFEYLMPLLVMPTYENTLLDDTYRASVKRQIAYGNQCGVAWGISESGYNTVDAALNYQYRAFGVPGLGLKRGLADDLVIAPYASALALMVTPEAACQNLQRLSADGLDGKFGFYEAIDYTAARLPRGQTSAVIRSFMAHHQGMILLSLAYLLLNRPMQKRFESDPMFQATTLLLQERVPRVSAFQFHSARFSTLRAIASDGDTPVRAIGTPTTPIPEVQLLSNRRYHVMVTNAGGGYSRWKDLAVTRWREDTTCDNSGTFCYIRDVASGALWSNTHQPTLTRAESYEAIFSEGRAEFRRRDDDVDTHTEIVVSPEDDIELRRVHITNRARGRRVIEVTSYAEVVLTTPAADALHPAFSNLFVQTEIIKAKRAILCTRRRRSQEDAAPWMFHLMVVHGATIGEVSYETDRLRFIGRGNSVAAPQSMIHPDALSGTAGSVLDPIVAIRYRITLETEQTASIDMVTGVGETREAAIGLIDKYQDRRLANRVFELAWTHSQVVLRQINATEADAQIYSRLANSVIHANASLRADPGVLLKNRRGQSGLWGYAISGDLPIVLVRIGEPSNIELVRQLVQAHAYWRLKGLVVDLVIWNEDRGGYRQLLQEQIIGLISAGIEAHVLDRPGGVFVRSAEHISDEDRILFESVARVILSDRRGPLADQISRRGHLEGQASHLKLPRFKPGRLPPHRAESSVAALPVSSNPAASGDDLHFHNGLGGFTPDGREYVIATSAGITTPAPWVNVLANPHFGSVISESGTAYTWSENAHEFRLTPWHNDPVTDTGGEAFYVRDEETGHFWSPTPLPSRGATPYVTRHGFGYSTFEHLEDGIRSALLVYVALDAAVKFSVLKITNESGRARRLSATGYVEWVLGDLKPKSTMHVISEIDPQSGAVFARNAYNSEFAERVAFFDVDDVGRTVSGDRAEFIGRNGNLARPAAMARTHLSNKVGAGLDPCAAIQVTFDLAEGEQHESIFRLGAGRNLHDARKLQQSWRGAVAAREAREKVRQYWQHTLGAVQIETPDAALNVLTNGWLLYQTLACRIWARSGYYQSGGAFGFRDQLQDAMALIHTEPQRLREQVLLCAGRQFREGDVQHWWHPPGGRGVRTHCSDDYLWLPLATCRYVLSTGDTGVLNVSLPFLEGRPVNAGDDSYYDLPRQSNDAASLYQHCVRAILHGLTFGERGLPLIGSGDWNDGMNLVGKAGKGESVWLAFFLCEVLRQFNLVARLQGDADFSDRCLKERETLAKNIEQHGWDGGWYRRAYFDDGTVLGSAANDECQIDSIAQSWSVLSGAGSVERSRAAMDALDHRLVRRADAIIQLLDPPFDRSALDPGYIKGYVPGIRENGGQYTHGAIWAAMAFAAIGDARRAWELTAMINPINHARSVNAVATYKVEPYVIAADVYALAPHTGRGGWSWYTGSAGWMYRLIVESLLGLRLDVNKLHIAPCIPAGWPGFTMHYRYRQTVYHIVVTQQRVGEDKPIEKTRVTVDGVVQKNSIIALTDDLLEHAVVVDIYLPGN